MRGPLVDITRFWKPWGARLESYRVWDSFGPEGDSDNEIDVFLNAPRPFHRLTELTQKHKCLFLLGRPGAGKTAEFERLLKPAIFPGETLISRRAEDLGTDGIDRIFKSEKWYTDGAMRKPIRLAIDGLDQSLILNPRFLNELALRFEDSPPGESSLSLVLTCRTAEWGMVELTANRIAALWDRDGSASTYELLPLSRSAALRLATERFGVKDGDAFFRECERSGLLDQAVWPRSMSMLAAEFNGEKRITVSLTELYWKRHYTSRLDDDADTGPSRAQTLRDAVRSTPEQRVEATSLIALTALATGVQRFRFSGGSDLPAGILDIQEIPAEMAKLPAGPSFGIASSQAFQDALHGGLFGSFAGAYEFLERSDVEFLAALRLKSLPGAQLMDFFGRGTGSHWRVYPQLATTAAMLAGFDGKSPSTFRAHLLRHDPMVLAQADLVSVPDSEKEQIVESLLEQVRASGVDESSTVPTRFRTLSHPALANQLLRWLEDDVQPAVVRDLALRIGIDAECTELAEAVWNLVLKGKAGALPHLSVAVDRICADGRNRWSQERFLQIVRREIPYDPYLSLAGAALHVLFGPKHRPASGPKLREVFGFLQPNPSNTFSAYDIFLQNAVDHLDRSDPEEVLGVLAELHKSWPNAFASLSRVRPLAEAALRAAIERLDVPKMADAVVRWWLADIEQGSHLLGGDEGGASLVQLGLDDPTKRQALLHAMLSHSATARFRPLIAWYFPSAPEDLPWLLERLLTAVGHDAIMVAAMAERWLRDRSRLEANSVLFEKAFAASDSLRSEFDLRHADADGAVPTILRRDAVNLARVKAEEATLRVARPRRPPYDAEGALQRELASFASGSLDRWPAIAMALSNPGVSGFGSKLWDALTIEELPGWEARTLNEKTQIREALSAYLIHARPAMPKAGSSDIPQHALVIALASERATLRTDARLRKAFSNIWVEALFHEMHPSRDPLPEVFEVLYGIDPDATLAVVTDRLRQGGDPPAFFAFEIFGSHPKDRIREAVAQELRVGQFHAPGVFWLAAHDRAAARDIALNHLIMAVSASPEDDEIRDAAIMTVLLGFPEEWKRAWPHFSADRAASERMLFRRHFLPMCREGLFRQPLEQPGLIARLFHWVIARPIGEVEDSRSEREIAWSELERDCRGALEEAGRTDLISQMVALAGAQDSNWARRSIRRAERAADASAWKPWSLKELVNFVAMEGGTRIYDLDSLRRAVVASLRRFEERARNAPVHHLWNGSKPRIEAELRDEILAHLKEDLPRVALIDPELTFASSERADFRVAWPQLEGPGIEVFAEVKQCGYYPQVESAMRAQLADRYLKAQGNTHGLYVVGWHTCSHWPKGKNLFQKRGLKAARALLERQAEQLSVGGISVEALVLDLPLNKRPQEGRRRRPKASPRSKLKATKTKRGSRPSP